MEEAGAFVATQAYLPISAWTILPVWRTYPSRSGTDGFFHTLDLLQHCLGGIEDDNSISGL